MSVPSKNLLLSKVYFKGLVYAFRTDDDTVGRYRNTYLFKRKSTIYTVIIYNALKNVLKIMYLADVQFCRELAQNGRVTISVFFNHRGDECDEFVPKT